MMRREDYKAVKRMDRAQMEKYLRTIYQRGYDAGVKSIMAKAAPAAQPDAGGQPPKMEG